MRGRVSLIGRQQLSGRDDLKIFCLRPTETDSISSLSVVPANRAGLSHQAPRFAQAGLARPASLARV